MLINLKILTMENFDYNWMEFDTFVSEEFESLEIPP
jgi:hypothetical protein